MTFEEALAEAEANARQFKSWTDDSGRTWIEVKGHRYPRDWFIRTAARMKANGEI